MSKIKVDWVLASERLPDTSRTVWIDAADEGIKRIDYGFYTGVAWFRGIYKVSGVTRWAEIEWPDPPQPVSQSFEGRIAGIGGTMRYLEIRNAEHQIRIHELPVTGFRTSMQVRVTVEEIVTDES